MKKLKVLIIQNKRIGDVLLSSIIAKNIKKNDPNSIIHFFCYDYSLPVLENHLYIDKIIAVDAKKLKKLNILLKYCMMIRKEKYDLILDPYSKFQSKLFCYLSNTPITAGNIRKDKKSFWKPHTHQIIFKKSKTMDCGKSIEDRVHLLNSVFELKEKFYKPKIFLTETEKSIKKIDEKSIIIGVLGSVASKSLPQQTMVQLIDKITEKYDFQILFNYAPHQRQDALAIYEHCNDKNKINFELYEPNLRQFLILLNQCTLLISNEGGSVHMAKALDKPTYTIYSPFINKESWNSFENLKIHESIHLADKRPDLYTKLNRKKLKHIEKNPTEFYNKLTANMIWEDLEPYLDSTLK